MTALRKKDVASLVKKLGNTSIVLIGMMGSGKSAMGKMVAVRLGLEFRDSDAEIEIAAKMPVAEIFENFGEPEFRRLENRVIKRLLSEKTQIIALGGGAFMAENTRREIARRAISVWLIADIELLLARVMRRPGKRPLLTRGDPRKIIEDLLLVRDPVYQQADLHVPSSGGTKTETRDAILAALASHFETKAVIQ